MRRPRWAILVAMLFVTAAVAHAGRATAPPGSCPADCDGDAVVRVDEIITAVDIALGDTLAGACPAADCPQPLPGVFINCLVQAVDAALNGCPGPTPTPLPAGTIRYDLQRGSTLFVGLPGSQVVQSADLSGSMSVVPFGPLEGNSVFHFAIARLAFRSAALGLTVIGDSGSIDAQGDGQVTMQAAVSIAGQSVELSGAEPLSVLLDYPPTFRLLRVCGAPGMVSSCDALEQATTTTYVLDVVAVPEGTRTTIPTATPTPTFPIRYRLHDGSTIAFRSDDPGAPLAAEPLSGTFTVLRCLMPPPNTHFLFTITTLALSSASHTVSGVTPHAVECSEQMGIGSIDASTLYPLVLFADVVIDGRAVAIYGGGPIDLDDPLPVFSNLIVCGAGTDRAVNCDAIASGESGYALTLFAAPDD